MVPAQIIMQLSLMQPAIFSNQVADCSTVHAYFARYNPPDLSVVVNGKYSLKKDAVYKNILFSRCVQLHLHYQASRIEEA